MLKNYLLVGVRNLLRNPLYSAINIGGLAIGLAACLLILLFVRDELSFDQWIPDVGNIHRVEITFYPPGRAPISGVQAPGPIKAAFEKDFSAEIAETTRMYRSSATISRDNQSFNQVVALADDNFFRVFDFPVVAGDRERAVADGTSLLLSEEMALKYFGDTSPLGETLTIDNGIEVIDYRVAGVLKDLPENSHLDIDFIARFEPERYVEERPWVAEQWTSTNMYIYARFMPGITAEQMTRNLPEFADRNVTFVIPGLKSIKPTDILEFHFLPVTDIHLRSVRGDGMKVGGDIKAVYTFAGVAFLILLIASMNFMNLATARSMKRAREVSMRKVLGARRSQLVGQFLAESTLMTLAALAVAIGLSELTLPWYNDFLGKSLTLGISSDFLILAAVAALAVVVGLLGGLYPAFYLSSFRPAKVLRANQSSANGSPLFRSILVVTQFAISIGLISATAIIYAQTLYARTMDLGYNKDHKMEVRRMTTEETREVAQTFHDEALKIPGVNDVVFSSDTFPQNSSNNTLVEIPGAPSDDLLVVETMTVSFDFFQFYEVEPLAGRLFSEEFRADVEIDPAEGDDGPITLGIVVNESALGIIGVGTPAEAVGMEVILTLNTGSSDTEKGLATIVGVIPDLHSRSIRQDINPTLYYVWDKPLWVATLDIRSGNLPGTLSAIDELWASLVPDIPIRRSFLDESFDALYAADEDKANMFAFFSAFAVFVASLGLFGLASFAAERKTKEIGIRKVMGASIIDIVRLLVWQFSKPVLLANLIAWPVAWYVMSDWLQGFQYRMDINPLLFAGAGIAALAIAWSTVGTHAFLVARANPVMALRYE